MKYLCIKEEYQTRWFRLIVHVRYNFQFCYFFLLNILFNIMIQFCKRTISYYRRLEYINKHKEKKLLPNVLVVSKSKH